MANLHKHFGWAVLASELSHVFCCVLPTLVTLLGVLSNLGLIGAAPMMIDRLHEAIHDHEVPIIIFSGVMVVLGWIVHGASREVDCHDTGCTHPPCGTKKKGNARILWIATLLFAVNIVIYFGIHRNVMGLEIFAKSQAQEIEHDHAHEHEHE